MSLPKTGRNKRIFKLRKQNPTKWSWRALGEEFNLNHAAVQRIYKRELALFKAKSRAR